MFCKLLIVQGVRLKNDVISISDYSWCPVISFIVGGLGFIAASLLNYKMKPWLINWLVAPPISRTSVFR